ncbi:hypothetical protein OG772_36255 [Streptomyces sp. NBC_01321]|uniref:hypothetical protein n=1 Tax=Streptomyces sp. NBC_01321 TaxID=2903825 RepID=UPI002E11913E|nr:hypothetical protein OG772_36255 [Streptomyces sp. NBC_01321]
MSEIAARAGVSETVASEALRAVKPPTERTLRRLLEACQVPFDERWRSALRAAVKAGRLERSELRELERVAAARAAPVVLRSRSAPELERRRRALAGHAHVHPDGDLPLVSQARDRALLGIHPAPPLRLSRPGVVLDGELPSYVVRDGDGDLRSHVRHGRDHGGLVLVHGPSTAGKTRAAAEAMWAELAGWALLVPVVPESLVHLAGARLDLTRTVIWLNELDVYLGPGGRQAEVLTQFLARPERPLVIATIRAHQLSDLEEGVPQDGSGDGLATHLLSDRKTATVVGGLLTRARRVRMERMFSVVELARAEQLREDTRLADALRVAGRYGVAEALAAGPELLRLLQAHTDAADGQFGGAAIIHASVDAARVGWRRPLQPALLRELLPHYVPSDLRQEVDDALFDRALRWARRRRRGFSRLLVDDETCTGVRAFDYLVDYAQTRIPQALVRGALWAALLKVATADEALELGHQAQRWRQADTAVAAWRRAACSPAREVAIKAAGALGRLLMERAEAEAALPYLRQAAKGGDWWAGSVAIDWYTARRRFEDALPVFRWRATEDSARGTRRALCNVLAALAQWEELAEVAKRFHAADSQMANRELLWCLKILAKWDPDGRHGSSEDELLKVFTERIDYRWWEHQVKDLVERLGDRSPHPAPPPTSASAEADRETLLPAVASAPPVSHVPSEAELLVATTSDRAWSRSEAWHALISLLWSQGRLAEGEDLLRKAAVADDVAAGELVRLLRITGRLVESKRWHRDDSLRHRLSLLVEQGELGEAARLVTGHDYHRGGLVELCVVHGLVDQARQLADAWAREGDPSPALELYRRAQQWEQVLAVLPPNAPREVRSRVPWGVDYGVDALLQLGRLNDAEEEARRLFEAGEGEYAFVLADIMVQRNRGSDAEALLEKIWLNGSGHNSRRARDKLGRLLSSQGRHAEAIRVLRDQSLVTVRHVTPRDDPVDRIAFAHALAGTGALDEAVEELRTHLRDFPPSSTRLVWLTMAELLDGHGRAADVPEMLQTAVPTDSGARYVLARRYLTAGQNESAFELLTSHPNDYRQFSDDMFCAVALATFLRDQGRVDDFQLHLWRTAELNWLEAAGELVHQGMWEELDDVIWAVDASGLVLPDNFQGLRDHTVRNDLDLNPAHEP